MQERGPTLGRARIAIAAAAALLGVALFVGSASAAKRPVEVPSVATLQGTPSSDGPFDTATATSVCPKGKIAFGGWLAEVSFGSGPGVATFALQRPSKREWAVSAGNSNSGPGDLTSLGYCGKAKKVEEVRGSTVVPPFAQATATATCPRKTSVRMGGVEGDLDPSDADPGVQVTGMVRSSKRTLQVSAVNVGEDTAGTLDAIAYCGKGPKLKQVTAATAVPPFGDLTATATCPKRKPLAFGGFQGVVDLASLSRIVVPHAARRSAKRSWTVTGANFAGFEDTASPGDVTSYAYCAKRPKRK